MSLPQKSLMPFFGAIVVSLSMAGCADVLCNPAPYQVMWEQPLPPVRTAHAIGDHDFSDPKSTSGSALAAIRWAGWPNAAYAASWLQDDEATLSATPQQSNVSFSEFKAGARAFLENMSNAPTTVRESWLDGWLPERADGQARGATYKPGADLEVRRDLVDAINNGSANLQSWTLSYNQDTYKRASGINTTVGELDVSLRQDPGSALVYSFVRGKSRLSQDDAIEAIKAAFQHWDLPPPTFTNMTAQKHCDM